MYGFPGALLTKLNERKIDKDTIYLQYCIYFFSQTEKMFKWNTPEYLPEKFIERYLQNSGVCAFEVVQDELTVLFGGWGGEPDKYYKPKYFTVENPYIPNEYNGTKKIGEDVEIILNDSYAVGLAPIITKYAQFLTENDISMRMASVMARAPFIFSASDDDTKASAELFIKRLFEGDLSVIGDDSIMKEGFKIAPTSTTGQGKIKELIELTQYYFATLENRLGLQSNYNMKRERLNEAETALNEDVLFPFVQNMLDERKAGAERVNAYCKRKGLDVEISVELASSWKDNFTQKDLEIKELEKDPEPKQPEQTEPESEGGKE